MVDLSQGFLEMADKLYERSDYIANFATHVSHELKTPLTAIRGATELMLDSADTMTEADRRKFLTNMLGDTQRLTALVDRMRALAKADNPIRDGVCELEAIARQLKGAFPGGEKLKCLIEVVEPIGSEVILLAKCGSDPVTARVDPATRLKSQTAVELIWDMNRMHLFDAETHQAY